MLKASTMSYIAQNMEVKRDGTQLIFTFEHRRVNIPIEVNITLEQALTKAANTAARRLFSEDCLGAILTLRMMGDDFTTGRNTNEHSRAKHKT